MAENSKIESLTLAQLVAETLVQKHRRLTRAKCRHPSDATHVSSYFGPEVAFTDTFCLDCGTKWRTDHEPSPAVHGEARQ